MEAEIPPLIVSTTVLAALLKLTPRRVQQLASEGVFPSVGHGSWDALVCVPAAHQHRLESEMARVEKTPGAERVRDLRAEEIELRLERESGALVAEAKAEALAIVDGYAGALRTGVMSTIPRHVKDLALRRTLEDALAAEFDAASKNAAAEASGSAPTNRAARRAARARGR